MLFFEIHESDFLDESFPVPEKWELRTAVRGVFSRESDGLIPILHVKREGYYKLPGGGVDLGESKADALKRELGEETGAEIKKAKEVGVTIEYKCKDAKMLISYIYMGIIDDIFKLPDFTKDGGFELLWRAPEDAYILIKYANPQSYIGKCIQSRDKRIIEYYINQYTGTNLKSM